MPTFVFLLLFAVPQPAADLLRRYVEAIGGEDALRAVLTRVTEGEFSNGRGLVTPFRVIEQAPNRRVTLIGSHAIDSKDGSGRGFDGAAGWDKNFIGTGLRVVEGDELADLKLDADMLRPLHLLDSCQSRTVEVAATESVVVCRPTSGARTRLHFDRATGLLVQQESEDANGRGPVRVFFEDYRVVDNIRLPFRTRIVLPGATITYTVASVRHNEPVQEAVFRRPNAQ